jgi:hypothetical protein
MNPEEQDQWLAEHVPYRIRASLTGLDFQNEFMPLDANKETRVKIVLHCRESSVSEGRIAAMRWLIEFVGVALDSKENVCRPRRHKSDVAITQLPEGKQFDLESHEAKFLSKVWKGCSQASGHPTQGTNHPSVDVKTLDEAIRIIIRHLEGTIYASGTRNLRNEAMIPLRPCY